MWKLRFPHAFTDSKDTNICTKIIQREKLWYNFPIVTEVILENKLFLSKRSIFRNYYLYSEMSPFGNIPGLHMSNPKMCNPKMSKSTHMCTRIFNQNSIQCSLPKMIIRVNTSFLVNVKVIWKPQANFKCFFLFRPLVVKIICQ